MRKVIAVLILIVITQISYVADGYRTKLIYSWSTGLGLSYTFPKKVKEKIQKNSESNQWLPK